MAYSAWAIHVNDVLRAHFKQPSGPSRAGADYAVTLKSGTETRQVIVRLYTDGKERSTQQEVFAVTDYLMNRLLSGWSPNDYTGMPGELVVPPPSPTAPPESGAKKPWWKIW